jgi:DNA-binding response OmpR family regulator
MNILIVDDSEQFREAAKQACNGHEVVLCEDGYQALIHLKRFRPDIVITDIDMPNLDGSKLSEIATSKGYKVIVMTGNDSPLDRAMAKYSCASGYIVKDQRLVESIKQALLEHNNE